MKKQRDSKADRIRRSAECFSGSIHFQDSEYELRLHLADLASIIAGHCPNQFLAGCQMELLSTLAAIGELERTSSLDWLTQNPVLLRLVGVLRSDPEREPEPLQYRGTNKWHDLLAEILASGDNQAILGIQKTLSVFGRIAERSPQFRSPSRRLDEDIAHQSSRLAPVIFISSKPGWYR